MNKVITGIIVIWIIINIHLILSNSENFFSLLSPLQVEGLFGYVLAHFAIMVGGSWGIHYVGHKFIAIRKKNMAKRYPPSTKELEKNKEEKIAINEPEKYDSKLQKDSEELEKKSKETYDEKKNNFNPSAKIIYDEEKKD